MSEAFLGVLPVFALVVVGYLAARSALWSEEGNRHLTRFVFLLVLPCLLFRTASSRPPGEALDVDLLAAYFGGAVALYLVVYLAAGLVSALRRDERAILAMGAVFSNTVLLGIPLVTLFFGADGLAKLSLIVAFNSVVLIPLASVFAELRRSSTARLGQAVVGPIVAVVQNPLVIAIAAGLVWSTTGLALPPPVDAFVRLVAGAAAPSALFVLGASLAAYRVQRHLPKIAAIAVAKLALHPLVVWGLARFVFRLDDLAVAVATLTAALPVGANVFVLARQYEAQAGTASAAILVSTALALATLAVLVPALS